MVEIDVSVVGLVAQDFVVNTSHVGNLTSTVAFSSLYDLVACFFVTRMDPGRFQCGRSQEENMPISKPDS
jgi:hypothetical protein